MSARRLWLSLLLLGAGSTLAHGEFAQADPMPNTVVSGPLEAVAITFSEPVEPRFSIFKVYRLEDGLGGDGAAGAATEHGGEHEAGHDAGHDAGHEGEHGPTSPDDPEWLRLNGLAGALVDEVLTLRGDTPARVDAGPLERGSSATVTLALPEGLAPGVYVVMWRVLAVDTHTTQGYYVFRVGSD